MRAPIILRLIVCSAVSALFAGTCSVGQAQTKNINISANVARQYGLELVWSTQVQLDRGKGRVIAINPSVSTRKKKTLFEVSHEYGKSVFAETQFDQFRVPLGIEGAQRKADSFVDEWKLLHPDSKSPPEVIRREIPEILLYASTELGTVHAIDGETGRTKWATTVGKVGYVTTAAAANDFYAVVGNGSSLYVLKASDGTLVWQKRMSQVPAAGIAVSQNFCFVPTTSGMIESYTLNKERDPPWIFKSKGRTFIPPVTGSGMVAWTSDAGYIYVASADPTRAMRFRLECHNTIDSPPAILRSRLFATSIDGYLYCLNLGGVTTESDRVLWKFSMESPSNRPPVAIEDAAFGISNLNQLFCVNIKDGTERWRTSGIRRIISVSKKRVYAMADVGRLAILDLKSRARIAEISTEEFDLPITNQTTDRIYLATSSGTVMCLREMVHQWPHVHGRETQSNATRKEAKQAADDNPEDPADPFAPPKAKADKMLDEDPFGGDKPMDKMDKDDPFGEPKKKADKKPESDPF